MKKLIGNEQLMLKACHLYYDYDLRQEDIAERLGLSRPTVSRLLKEAKAAGIVKIKIVSPFLNDYYDLEKLLEDHYHLKYVVVVDDKDDMATQNQEIAKAAAAYLTHHIHDDDIVALSMGTTLREIAKYFEKPKAKNVTFVPMLGGIGKVEIEIHPNRIVTQTAEAFGGKYLLLHAPALISNPATLEIIRNEDSIRTALNYIDRANIAVVGIGNPLHEASSLMASGYYNNSDFEQFKKNKAVGDICMQIYNADGKTEPFDANNRVLGIKLEQMKKISNVIAVAGGSYKLESIRAGIKGGFFNILITNYSNAIGLANYIKK